MGEIGGTFATKPYRAKGGGGEARKRVRFSA